MLDRNKRFRTHCNIEVLLDREENCVTVNVAYKEEFVTDPLCREKQEYTRADVVEELNRQGIYVGAPLKGKYMRLDNTTVASKYTRISDILVFPLAPKVEENNTLVTEEPAESVDEPKPAPVKKRRSRKTKTNK